MRIKVSQALTKKDRGVAYKSGSGYIRFLKTDEDTATVKKPAETKEPAEQTPPTSEPTTSLLAS